MGNRAKGLVFVLILLFVTGFAFAQREDQPLDFLTSPTANSTAYQYYSDADNFIQSAYYKEVEFEKWFDFASFASTTNATLGFAKYFGSVYIGAYYGGNLFRGFNNKSYTENIRTHGTDKTLRTYSTGTTISNTVNDNNNRIAVLVGTGDMGFRFSFASNYDSFSDKDLEIVGIHYKEYKNAAGWFSPQFQWGMTKTLLPQGIQPTITFDLGFYRYYTRYDVYDNMATWDTEGIRTTNSRNYIQPELEFNLGGFTISENDNLKFDIDLDYKFSFKIHRNKYSWQDGSNYKTATIKGINTNGSLTQDTWQNHSLIPSIGAEYINNNRLGFSASFGLPLELTLSRRSVMTRYNLNGDIHKNGSDAFTTSFAISPSLFMGLQYKLIPGKLLLNAGGRITAATITMGNVSTDTYAAGVKSSTKTLKTRSLTFSTPTITNFTIGVNFFLNENVTFEAMTGVNGNTLNIFGAGVNNINTFSSILASVKF